VLYKMMVRAGVVMLKLDSLLLLNLLLHVSTELQNEASISLRIPYQTQKETPPSEEALINGIPLEQYLEQRHNKSILYFEGNTTHETPTDTIHASASFTCEVGSYSFLNSPFCTMCEAGKHRFMPISLPWAPMQQTWDGRVCTYANRTYQNQPVYFCDNVGEYIWWWVYLWIRYTGAACIDGCGCGCYNGGWGGPPSPSQGGNWYDGQYEPTEAFISASSDIKYCLNCPAGTYNPSSGQTACTLCAKGEYSPVSGASSCDQCPPGTYSNLDGMSACTLCPDGKYSDLNGSVSCKSCLIGKYTTSKSLTTDCTWCEAGKYRFMPISLPWAPMQQTWDGKLYTYTNRTYQNQPVYFCDAVGEYMWWWVYLWKRHPGGACTDGCECRCDNYGWGGPPGPAKGGYWENGQYEPMEAFVLASSDINHCLNCLAGTYNPSPGRTTCTQCAKGEYSPVSGASSCAQCPPGTYSNLSGMSACTLCTASCPIGQNIQALCTPTSPDISCSACPPVANCFFAPDTPCGNATNPNCTCFQGLELSAEARCQPCKAGFFRSANSPGPCVEWKTAASCAAGHFLSNGTRFSDAVCIPCPAPPNNNTLRSAGCQWGCSAGYNSTF
jgi:hypothetical protein